MNQVDLNYNQFGHINRVETRSFLLTALTWHGSVSPIVLPRVIFIMIYLAFFNLCQFYFLFPVLPMKPFEYTGFALGILLVLRLNAGLERWWEARKIWGQIVNQSRNLALIGYGYSKEKNEVTKKFLHYTACWPFVMFASLTNQNCDQKVRLLLDKNEFDDLEKAKHRPIFIAEKVIHTLKELRAQGLDDFAFHHAERERALLIDAIGACERIVNTPIPFVLAIKIRRFILMFLIILPFGIDKTGIYSILISALVSYTLFSLDEIGVQLQNPFSQSSLSRLPIEVICQKIYDNVLDIEKN